MLNQRFIDLMAKTEEEKLQHLESISFSNLVKAIDEKWSHTYLEYVPEEDFEEESEELQ